MSSFLLIHSPLVGPSTMAPLARELSGRGHHATVAAPGREAADRGWREWVERVAGSVGNVGSTILVGHSGSGPLLPFVAEKLSAYPEMFIFIDAGLPPDQRPIPLIPADFQAHLANLATDGLLPRWADWFGPGAMDSVIPDARLRRRIEGELPQLPLSYFKDELPPTSGWAQVPCGYLLLSDPYRAVAGDAAARGWPVRELPGTHLEMALRPEAAAEVLEGIVEEVRRAMGDRLLQ